MTLRRYAGAVVQAVWSRRPRAIRRAADTSPHPLTPSEPVGRLERFGIRRPDLSLRAELAWIFGVAGALIALLWLDYACNPFGQAGAPEVRTAAAFGAVWAALEIFSSWIATAAEITATYLWIAVQWLSSVTAGFLRSTGAMFSRVWDATRIVWSDVLKPALQWLDATLKRYYDWLQRTFRPVFDFLRDVRDRIRAFYNTFVRPVTDTIEFIRQVNRVLLTFHIDVLQKLDRTLQQVEQRIDEPFIWINQKLNEITNFVNSIVTVNGLFERIRLVKSLAGYAPSWIAGFWNSQINAPEVAARTRAITDLSVDLDVTKAGDDLSRFYRGESSDIDADVAECVALWAEAAGVNAPTL